MAQAVRAFMTEMEFPPESEKGGHSSNAAYAGVVQALLNHAKALKLDATEVRVEPSVKQLAAICHCAPRTVQRILEKLKKHGIVTRMDRGAHLSSVYTVHKQHSRHDKDVTPKSSRGDKADTPESAVRGDTLPGSEVTRQASGVTPSPSRGDNDVVLWDKASGREASGIKPLGDTTKNVSLGSSSDELDPAPGTLGSNGDTHDDDSAPTTNATGNPKRFSLKRWCNYCNEQSKHSDGDECPHCGENISEIGDWLKAPKTDTDGKRLMEQILNTTEADRRNVYVFAPACQRRWIALTKFADEQAKVLAESEATSE
jgi:DNA-binding transcriptional regulator YhcF (GntR family)